MVSFWANDILAKTQALLNNYDLKIIVVLLPNIISEASS